MQPEPKLKLVDGEHHNTAEEIVDWLQLVTEHPDRHYLRCLTAYYLAAMATTLHIKVKFGSSTLSPNIFAFLFGPSGSGKSFSASKLHNDLLEPFYAAFTRPEIMLAKRNKTILNQAVQIATRTGVDDSEILESLSEELSKMSELQPTYEDLTTPALRNIARYISLTGSGSLNVIIDEIANSLTPMQDTLVSLMRTYDTGEIKDKALKEQDSSKKYSLTTHVPTNLLAYGTPQKIFDMDTQELNYRKLNEQGYGRRSLFAYNHHHPAAVTDPKAYWEKLNNTEANTLSKSIKNKIVNIVNVYEIGEVIELEEDAGIELCKYKQLSDELAKNIVTNEIYKTELMHRHQKALRLATIYAVLDHSKTITKTHVIQATNVTTESSNVLSEISVKRTKAEALLDALVDMGQSITYSELDKIIDWLPKYSTFVRDLLPATASEAYSRNVIIKQQELPNDVLKFEAIKLTETNISKIKLSTSASKAANYAPNVVKFTDIPKLFRESLYANVDERNFCTHTFKGNHRSADSVNTGFNLVVLDIDNTAKINEVKAAFEEYTYLLYYTKSHDPVNNLHHFRVILPISHVLHLQPEEHKQFMELLFKDLPFDVDVACKDIARKWRLYPEQIAKHELHETGILFDATTYIPNTRKSDLLKDSIHKKGKVTSEDRLEQWVIREINEHGQRNNMLYRYLCALSDQQTYSKEALIEKVDAANQQLNNPLMQQELDETIYKRLKG